MELLVITGMPGAGKSTYVRSRIRNSELVFDLDCLADALDTGIHTRMARDAAGILLNNIIQISRLLQTKRLYIIRTSPTDREIDEYKQFAAKYVEVERNSADCRKIRPMDDEEWCACLHKHEDYLKRVFHQTICIDSEKW